MDMNLNSVFWATRAALRHMLPQHYGRIINISSVEGKMGNKATVSHYITGKHALNGFTKATAFEYGTEGITCNAICPGAVETDLMQDVGPSFAEQNGISYEEYKQAYTKDAAIRRLNTVEEVAAMAVLLASDVGGGITGALLNVDGGTAPY
jgi:3-hydroxybutyrate dehydrogenase